MPSTTIGLTNIDPAVATTLVIYQGNNQKTPPSTAFPLALSTRAVNGLGDGVAGISITYTAPASGATMTMGGLTTKTFITGPAGYAVTDIPVASATNGTFAVTASASGVGPITFNEQVGQNYLAEVCTSSEASQSVSSSAFLSSGSPIAAWSNPASAIAAGGGGSFAQNLQQPPNSNRSQGLFFIPTPASWAAIKTDSLITKITFRCWGNGVPGNGTLGQLLLSFLKGGGVYIINSQSYTGFGTNAFAQMALITLTPPGAIYGADIQAANTGWILNVAPNSATGSTTAFQINGAIMTICYQDVVPPPPPVNIPLQVCNF